MSVPPVVLPVVLRSAILSVQVPVEVSPQLRTEMKVQFGVIVGGVRVDLGERLTMPAGEVRVISRLPRAVWVMLSGTVTLLDADVGRGEIEGAGDAGGVVVRDGHGGAGLGGGGGGLRGEIGPGGGQIDRGGGIDQAGTELVVEIEARADWWPSRCRWA